MQPNIHLSLTDYFQINDHISIQYLFNQSPLFLKSITHDLNHCILEQVHCEVGGLGEGVPHHEVGKRTKHSPLEELDHPLETQEKKITAKLTRPGDVDHFQSVIPTVELARRR